jgi:hypothetical protein
VENLRGWERKGRRTAVSERQKVAAERAARFLLVKKSPASFVCFVLKWNIVSDSSAFAAAIALHSCQFVSISG